MTIQDLGSIGEIVGAAATVATLLYLSIQIRNSTQTTRAEAERSITDRNLALMSAIVENEQVARILEKALEDPASLESTELLRFETLMAQHITNLQQLYGHYTKGFADSEWTGLILESYVNGMLGSTGGRAWWARTRENFNSAFRREIDAALSNRSPSSGSS